VPLRTNAQNKVINKLAEKGHNDVSYCQKIETNKRIHTDDFFHPRIKSCDNRLHRTLQNTQHTVSEKLTCLPILQQQKLRKLK